MVDHVVECKGRTFRCRHQSSIGERDEGPVTDYDERWFPSRRSMRPSDEKGVIFSSIYSSDQNFHEIDSTRRPVRLAVLFVPAPRQTSGRRGTSDSILLQEQKE